MYSVAFIFPREWDIQRVASNSGMNKTSYSPQCRCVTHARCSILVRDCGEEGKKEARRKC